MMLSKAPYYWYVILHIQLSQSKLIHHPTFGSPSDFLHSLVVILEVFPRLTAVGGPAGVLADGKDIKVWVEWAEKQPSGAIS